MNTTYSPRTLLAVRRERELVELSIVLYRRLRTGTGRECAELFTHAKNRETIAVIKGLVSAYAALKDAVEIPSEFFTTKILLRISMQIMVVLQTRTRDPIAIFKRIYDREIAAQTYLKEKDPYIIYAARVDEHFGFPITTLLCPALNYARYYGRLVERMSRTIRLPATISACFSGAGGSKYLLSSLAFRASSTKSRPSP